MTLYSLFENINVLNASYAARRKQFKVNGSKPVKQFRWF